MASMAKTILCAAVMVLSLTSLAAAISGTATYYTTYVPSACYGYQNNGVMIAAASNVLWNNGGSAGRGTR
ncbi:EG45-like domain containing protein [Acorus gramineus]|uniref:EG45-like domain containing protein n=1 Tax=Acorus gramineus TaxID=55184 RepID=A0AAV9B056_ACOGR|nr:EG45-like domain containing protein [Acorus gramineus]